MTSGVVRQDYCRQPHMPPRALTDISPTKRHASAMLQGILPRITRESLWKGARTALLRRPPSAPGHARLPHIVRRKLSPDSTVGLACKTQKPCTIGPNLIKTRRAPSTTHISLGMTTRAQLPPILADTPGTRLTRISSLLTTNQSSDLNANQQTNAQTQQSPDASSPACSA